MRVLIVGANWLGDAVMSTPAIHALRALYPTAHMAVLTPPELVDIYEMVPVVDQGISYTRRGVLKGVPRRIAVGHRLRREAFDLAVLFPNSFGSAVVAWAAGARRRVGFAANGRRALLTDAYPLLSSKRGVHQVDAYVGLVAHLGAVRVDPTPRLTVRRDDARAAADLLDRRRSGGPRAAVIPGAAYGPAKRWFPERFAALVRHLVTRWDAEVLLLGSDSEVALAAEVAEGAGVPARNLAGQTSLGLLAALLQGCDLVVSIDTGSMHLAAAVGAPVVALFGSTDPRVTGPRGEATVLRHLVPCSPCFQRTCAIGYLCFEGLSVPQVWAAVDEVLSRRRRGDASRAGVGT